MRCLHRWVICKRSALRQYLRFTRERKQLAVVDSTANCVYTPCLDGGGINSTVCMHTPQVWYIRMSNACHSLLGVAEWL